MITKASFNIGARFWFVLIFCLSVLPVIGRESDWYAHTWQSDDGLPDNYVTGVGQTSDGFLWVATQGGLVRFDGVQFKRLGLPALSGMPVAMIRSLIVSKGNELWLALEGGVVISANANETRVFTTADGLPPIRPASMVEDGEGGVWVGYWDDSACRISGRTVTRYTAKDGLPYTGFCALTVDARKQLWFAEGNRVGTFREGHFVSLITVPGRQASLSTRSAGGLWIAAGQKLFRYQEGSALIPVAELPPLGGDVEPLALFEDRAQTIWMSTTISGLYRFEGTNVTHIKTPHREIRTITQDREGNMWIGTSGAGLSRLYPQGMRLWGIEQGLPFETVQSVCEDADGKIWAVAQNGLLARMTAGAWQLVSTNDDWPGGQASSVAADNRGNVWIGTLNHGLYRWNDQKYELFRRTNGMASDKVWALMTDSHDDVWISLSNPNCVERLHDGAFQRFELPAGSHVVRTWVEDKEHRVWMGTEDGRLLQSDPKGLTDETSQTLSKLVPIRHLNTTSDGALWLAYGGAGVGCLSGGKFTTVGIAQGLPDDFISQIEPDGSNRLWFAGNKGVFEVDRSDLAAAQERSKHVQANLFGRNEGLTSLQANFGYGPHSLRTRDGRLCFSMLTGLLVVDPQKIAVDRVAPPVVIEKVSVNGNDVPFPNSSQLLRHELALSNSPSGNAAVELLPQHHDLEIDFAALSFTAPQNVRFRYQLSGYDAQPVDTLQRGVSYSQVPPGHYVFKVTACNSSGIWNETGATFEFSVRPFVWQRWWFRLGLLMAIVSLTAAIIYYSSVRRLHRRLWRLEQESAVARDRARIAKDLHDDLGAHLSHIAMLSELAQTDLDKPAQARSHIDQIFRNARLLTRSLDEIVWEVNPKNDTLDRFIGHICQFAPEFLRPAGVRCRMDMPMDLPAIQLDANVRHQLYLGFKESLHNIVKHADATEVWLRLELNGDTIVFTVEDNGRGFETRMAARAGEDGLANLQDRMNEVGGAFAQESQPGRGTQTKFTVPITGLFK